MGIYIGFVEIKGYEPTIFFNFKPIAEVKGNDVLILTTSDREELLPKSENRNINFSYKFNSTEQRKEMEDYFSEKCLVIFDFVLSDLDDNVNARNGVRNQTGYIVNALDMIDSGKIRKINTADVYQVIPKEDILSDFYNDPIVEIQAGDITIGSEVFVDLGSFYAGPYEVGFREITQTFYIRPQIKNSKYTINGYTKKYNSLISLSDLDNHWDDYRWTVMRTKHDAPIEQLDVITDALLLESFRESIGIENIKDGRVIIDDIDKLLKQYETSLLTGLGITEPIRKKRLNRLVELLTSEEELTDTLSYITESLCGLLIRHKDEAEVDEWLQETLSKHPEFWDRIRDVRVVGNRIDQLNQAVEELQQQKNNLDAEIQEKREKAVSIDLQAIEEKKKEMLAVDTEYAASKARLDSLLATLGMVEDIAALNRKHDDIQSNVTYIEMHKRHLENDARYLEAQFSQLISNQHDKMLNIAFDGFMASKMLKAAAEWEAEETKKLGIDFVRAANNVTAEEKTAEDLVNYLTRTVQIVRPQYSKNTIINIAICTTQGFLTVFSGEPGCGKTSICNIYSDVLGLNKIEGMVESSSADYSAARYVPVSVERGWTSKRDFVGYYNPLSKSFDKSNRDVYDALSRLHIEQTSGLNKFPFVILLDEANLSPMEYYWADFMYICDDTGKKHQINLGDNNVLSIPDTLHFVATINNDHTTETLSPRLIDRAWIVQLPQQVGAVSTCAEIPEDQIELITWDSLRKTFGLDSSMCVMLPPDIQKIYDAISAHLRKAKLYISPRVEIAIKRYWFVAAQWFEKELGIEPPVVALDYAIAQKVLPKIQGHGDDYEKWLEELRAILNSNDLNMSAKIVKDITERGVQQMKYFQFFA